jgi:hypothetical protein
VRLAVPALGVDAPVEPVGIRDDGQMALPDDVDRLGWYRFGPVPGAEGSAVLAGHVDDAEQGLGALARCGRPRRARRCWSPTPQARRPAGGSSRATAGQAGAAGGPAVRRGGRRG